MTSVADMDILKEIPGYKAIMKAVLKTQIQLLVEQLSDHTGEESIVLTASVNDGSLSHLGSSTGKGFLEGRDEIKSQFLGYCLKSHHKRKTQEEPAPPYQRSNVSHPGPRTALQQSAKRPRLHPVSLTRAQPGSDGSGHLPGDSGEDAMFTSTPVRGQRDSSAGPSRSVPSESPSNVKLEQSGILSGEIVQPSDTDLMTPASLPSSIRLSHTQTSAMDKDQSDKDLSDTGDASQDSASIKVEPVTESELDLEITGVEMGDNSSQMSGENWSQIGSGASGDGSFDQSGNQAGYIITPTTGKAKAGQRGNSRVAVQDQTRKQIQGVGHMVNYDAQSFYTRKYLGNVMDWRVVSPQERPLSVAQHIKDAFIIKPPGPFMPETPGAQKLAAKGAVNNKASLIPQIRGNVTKQPSKETNQFRHITPEGGPRTEPQLYEKLVPSHKGSVGHVTNIKRPVGRPPKNPNTLPANLAQLKLKKKVGRPRKQEMKQISEVAVANPSSENPVKRKVGRPRKNIPEVFPVSLTRMYNVMNVKAIDVDEPSTSNAEKISPPRKNYVEPIDDIIDTDDETVTNTTSSDIDNNKTVTIGLEQMQDKTSEDANKSPFKGSFGGPRKEKGLEESASKDGEFLPSGVSFKSSLRSCRGGTLKRPRGRPRKYPVGNTGKRPFFGKPLPSVSKRPVGRPRKVTAGGNLGESKAVHLGTEGNVGLKKVPVVLVDDILKTKPNVLLNPKPETDGKDSDEKMCIVDVYEQKIPSSGHIGEMDIMNSENPDKQVQYGEMVVETADNSETPGPSQTAVFLKSKVHLPAEKWEEILDVADKEGVEAASSEFGVAASTIYKRRAKMRSSEIREEGIPKESDEKTVSHQMVMERSVGYLKMVLEKNIIDWVREQKKENKTVTVEMVKVYALTITVGKIPEFEATDEWLKSFIERNNLSDLIEI